MQLLSMVYDINKCNIIIICARRYYHIYIDHQHNKAASRRAGGGVASTFGSTDLSRQKQIQNTSFDIFLCVP